MRAVSFHKYPAADSFIVGGSCLQGNYVFGMMVAIVIVPPSHRFELGVHLDWISLVSNICCVLDSYTVGLCKSLCPGVVNLVERVIEVR